MSVVKFHIPWNFFMISINLFTLFLWVFKIWFTKVFAFQKFNQNKMFKVMTKWILEQVLEKVKEEKMWLTKLNLKNRFLEKWEMKVKTKMKMMKINKIKARKEWIWKMILKEKINNKIKMRRMIKKMKNKTIYRMSLMMYKKKI